MARGTKTKRGLLNLRTTETGRFGHYTAHLLDPALQTAFIAVCNPRLRLLVLYVFNRFEFLGSATGKNPIAALTYRGMVASSVEGLS